MLSLFDTQELESCVNPLVPPPSLTPRLSRQERQCAAAMRFKNKDRAAFNAQARELYKLKRETDPVYCESRRQRQRLYNWLRSKGIKYHTYTEFNYSPDDLRAHLESLWSPGMTWENYGKRPGGWSIDHIRPVSEFVKGGITDPRVVSALSNIRPLWAHLNGSKGPRKAPVTPAYSREKTEYTGEKHHLAKLTAADARAIKARLAEGGWGVLSQIAREYGVAVNTIQQIKQGTTWKDA